MSILFCVVLLFSCKKDKVFTCEGVQMAGDRSVFVGKWRWYKTSVEQWFDVGPSNWIYYTPQNQGFDYYFTISTDGKYEGYRNDTLVHDILLSSVDYEYLLGDEKIIVFFINCSSQKIYFNRQTYPSTTEKLIQFKYPFNFEDPENHLTSKVNYFARE